MPIFGFLPMQETGGFQNYNIWPIGANVTGWCKNDTLVSFNKDTANLDSPVSTTPLSTQEHLGFFTARF